ncbi:MAG: hypothetical protein U5L00_18845 [Desulfovermiculus sp.]|nr:hypothetical protein [Desulfovermiculus sp.]
MKIRTLILSSIFICCFLMSTAHVQAQSYAKQVAKGEELVQALGRLMEQNAGINALEEMAVRISQSYQARLAFQKQIPASGPGIPRCGCGQRP